MPGIMSCPGLVITGQLSSEWRKNLGEPEGLETSGFPLKVGHTEDT